MPADPEVLRLAREAIGRATDYAGDNWHGCAAGDVLLDRARSHGIAVTETERFLAEVAKLNSHDPFLPCPVCGEAKSIKMDSADGWRAVRCATCEYRGAGEASEESATVAWNRDRPEVAKLDKEPKDG